MRKARFYFYCRQQYNDAPMDVEMLVLNIKHSLDAGVTYSEWETVDLVTPEAGLYMFSVPINARLIFHIEYKLALHPPPYDTYMGQLPQFYGPIVEGCYDFNAWIQKVYVEQFHNSPNVNWPKSVFGYDFMWDCYSKTPNELKRDDWVGTNVDPYEGLIP